MINEEYLKKLVGRRVTIGIKNLDHVCGGILVSIVDGNVILDPRRDGARIHIAIEDIANIMDFGVVENGRKESVR